MPVLSITQRVKKKIEFLLQIGENPLLYIVLLVIVISLFTLYRSLTQIRFDDAEIDANHTIPLVTIYQPVIEIFNDSGVLAYTVYADSIEHYKKPLRSIVYQPLVHLLDVSTNSQWRVSGDKLQYSSNDFIFDGNVVIVNNDRTPDVHIHTQKLLYDTETEIVTIPVQSEIQYGDSRMHAGSARIEVSESNLYFDNTVTMIINAQQDL